MGGKASGGPNRLFKHLKGYIVSAREMGSITGLHFLSEFLSEEQSRIEEAKAEVQKQ
jgi:hypothetical protein